MQEIIEAKRIWDIDKNWKGKSVPAGGEVHPDLVWFKGHWYCGFKETGRSRLLRSADGETWETARVFELSGAFVGRPYLSVAPEGALMVNAWICPLNHEDDIPKDRRGHPKSDRRVGPVKRYYVTWLSLDGVNWSPASAHHTPLGFSVTWHNAFCYGVGMDGALHYSCDGKHWDVLLEKFFPEREAVLSFDRNDWSAAPGTKKTACNETGLYFSHEDDSAVALTRTNPVCVIMGTAAAPDYQEWTWRDVRVDWNGDGELRPAHEVMGVQLGCPVVKRMSDGRLYGIGRTDASDETTNRSRVALFMIDVERAVLTVFAKLDGYGGYSGVVERDGLLHVACSNNTFPCYDVFLLKLKVPAA